MPIKLTETECKVMDALWQHGDLTATQLVQLFAASTGWNKNTTYTMIKKCIEKGAIQRIDPGFTCHALVSRQEVQQAEVDRLLDRLFEGSADALFASLLGRKKLPPEELDRLKAMIDEASGGQNE